MPLCHFPSRAAAISAVGLNPLRQPFTTSARRLAQPHDDKESHYDILQVPHNASPAEIKRSFYALSKKHHPDHNPSDPHASRRFVRISEAYSVLSAPAKRAAYDRDARHSHAHSHHATPSHQYATGPAGGRPASGLGRRRPTTNSTRGSFRGPPPSFYRQGGWGEHHEKRKEAHEQSTAGGGGSSTASSTSSGVGGMGPGQDPFGHKEHVPHFDTVSHERTHKRQDQRRASRRAADESPLGGDGSSPVAFVFIVSGILVVASLVPLLFAPSERPRRRPKKQPTSKSTKQAS
ncbi:hypothetical protein jhhlp_006385 [Lomentospora prolificans]|uniref:J domain-containing protein n=1 Tax=Lomentospora prolificans TaxID=41688 RepID=A0A2N3N5T7_9PEZI|nr:hypothetical protein jhhlp_006385 [Lomentospora prolificans]